jgi:acetyl-CoA C-acetyltransferase/acetyl-CoA acyltransferase
MQIRGDFPGFKASSPDIALTHNIGGVATVTAVSILKRVK